MNETELKAKLNQVLDGLVMTQYQRDTLRDIIVQINAAATTESDSLQTLSATNKFESIQQLEADADISDVITTVNQIISALKS